MTKPAKKKSVQGRKSAQQRRSKDDGGRGTDTVDNASTTIPQAVKGAGTGNQGGDEGSKPHT